MAYIEAKGIHKTFGKGDAAVHALRGASLSVDKGEMVAVMGKSGSGKSTLLNILGGIDSLTTGEMIVNESPLSRMTQDTLAEYRANEIGFIFQFYNLIPNLTVYENVALMKEIKEDILDPMEVLERVGLKNHSRKFPSQLSGGEQQRVAIARAMVNHPLLLLADEPTGNLDPITAKEIMDLLVRVQKIGTTVVTVTHNKELVNTMGKRVISLEDGRVGQDEARGSYDI